MKTPPVRLPLCAVCNRTVESHNLSYNIVTREHVLTFYCHEDKEEYRFTTLQLLSVDVLDVRLAFNRETNS